MMASQANAAGRPPWLNTMRSSAPTTASCTNARKAAIPTSRPSPSRSRHEMAIATNTNDADAATPHHVGMLAVLSAFMSGILQVGHRRRVATFDQASGLEYECVVGQRGGPAQVMRHQNDRQPNVGKAGNHSVD